MRAYADLHLSPPLDDTANARSMASLLTQLQTRVVGLVVPPERSSSSLPIAEVFRNAGIDVATRLDVNPKSREELLKSLRRFRSKYEIISVECNTSHVSRVAVRDRRVDIIHFPKQQSGNLFRGNLAKSCRAALEFNLSELISDPTLETRLRLFRREIETAAETSTTVIGSSNASNPFGLRSPRDIAAVLYMIGLPLDLALRGVSDIPLGIVKKNRLRLAEPQIDEGVRILRRSTRNE